MTIAFATRHFITGTVVQSPFAHTLGNDSCRGRVELTCGEALSPDTWVTPILRRRLASNFKQGPLVCVNADGRMNSEFGSVLARNSEMHELGERSMNRLTKVLLSTLMGWLIIEPSKQLVDLPMYALEIFPRQSALSPLPRL